MFSDQCVLDSFGRGTYVCVHCVGSKSIGHAPANISRLPNCSDKPSRWFTAWVIVHYFINVYMWTSMSIPASSQKAGGGKPVLVVFSLKYLVISNTRPWRTLFFRTMHAKGIGVSNSILTLNADGLVGIVSKRPTGTFCHMHVPNFCLNMFAGSSI